jgi:hypothetical protein
MGYFVSNTSDTRFYAYRLWQLSPCHYLKPISLRLFLSVFSHLFLGLPNGNFSWDFRLKCTNLISYPCPLPFYLTRFITIIICGEWQKWWSYSLRNIPVSSYTSFLGSNTAPTTLFSDTPNKCSSLNKTDKVSDNFRVFWWWRQYAPLKRRSTSTWPHGSTSQKTLNFRLDAVRTWNLTKFR